MAAGTLGYLAGSLAGWAIGAYGGRALIDHPRQMVHFGPARFARAERRFGPDGSWAVFLRRLTPLVRSFVPDPPW